MCGQYLLLCLSFIFWRMRSISPTPFGEEGFLKEAKSQAWMRPVCSFLLGGLSFPLH